MVDTLSTLSVEAKEYYDLDLLYRAQAAQVMYQGGQKRNVGKNKGNSISWRRFNSLSVATTALTEGTTPSATSLSTTEVTATIAQYGAFAEISDALDMLGIDPVISEAIGVMGQQAGESIESVIANEIDGGTSVSYGTGAARNLQDGSNPLTIAMVRKAARDLDANNARRFNGPEQNKMIGQGHYLGLIHPNAVYDLKNDSEWKTHQQQSPGYEKLYNGEVFEIEGVRFLQSTLAPVFTGAGASSADVYGTIIFGQHAFGVVDVNGTGKFNTIAKQLGSSGTSDPLDQRATVGWKSFFVAKILNNNFMTRLEAGVSS